MKKIASIISLILIGLMIGSSVLALTLYQHQTAYTGDGKIFGTFRGLQTFTPNTFHEISMVSGSFYETGINTTEVLTIEIYACGVDHKPTGSILASGNTLAEDLPDVPSGAWTDIALDDPVWVNAGVEYCLVAYSNGTNVWWNFHDIDVDTYSRGTFGLSSNDGVSWTLTANWDWTFEEYGAYHLFGWTGNQTTDIMSWVAQVWTDFSIPILFVLGVALGFVIIKKAVVLVKGGVK